MALGYGTVYELRDLPKAVRRKFISKLLSLKRLLGLSRSRGIIMMENARPISASQVKFHMLLRSSVIRAYSKYFLENFRLTLYNGLIIPMFATIVKIFEDYRDSTGKSHYSSLAE